MVDLGEIRERKAPIRYWQEIKREIGYLESSNVLPTMAAFNAFDTDPLDPSLSLGKKQLFMEIITPEAKEVQEIAKGSLNEFETNFLPADSRTITAIEFQYNKASKVDLDTGEVVDAYKAIRVETTKDGTFTISVLEKPLDDPRRKILVSDQVNRFQWENTNKIPDIINACHLNTA